MLYAIMKRNPEGMYGDVCPNCKSKLKQNKKGDLHCENFTLTSLEIECGKCPWHRYSDGTNYWSPPEELMKILSEMHGIPIPKGYR